MQKEITNMADQQGAAIRKRQQIAKANRMMFLWVAGVSVIVGVSVVISIFLFQKLTFNEKVLSEQNKTVKILKSNNDAVSDLRNNVRQRNTSEALLAAKSNSDDEALQVILDALPSTANSSAFGASLQQKLMNSPGIIVDSLTVEPVADEQSGDATSTSSSSTDAEPGTIQFTATVTASGGVSDLYKLLGQLERSVRAINVKSATVEVRNQRAVMTLVAETYYEPAKKAELMNKVIKP